MGNWQTFRDDEWTQSSFVVPVAAPNVEPDATPLVCVQFNQTWLPYVLGSLFQLQQQGAWDPASPGADVASQQAQKLMSLIGETGGCPGMLEFRFEESCELQYSTDAGTTWIDVPGWSSFSAECFTGPAGPTGATGPPGPASTWRLENCQLQYSNDGGVTWTTVSGFSTSELQLCLQGTPGNPQGVTIAQQACNVAGWLAQNVLQGSLSNAATSIGAGATLLDAVLSLGGLAFGFAALLDPFVLAAAAFYTAAIAIGATLLNSAAADSTLREDLTCAIYSAISTTGYVTGTNISAVLTNINDITYGTPGIVGLIHDYVANLGIVGINGIQAEGSLFGADCSECAPPAGCVAMDGAIIGTGVTYAATGPGAGIMTVTGASGEYGGAAGSSPDQSHNYSLQAKIAVNRASIGFYTTAAHGLPSQGDNAWVNSIDVALVWAAGTWYVETFGAVQASGSGGSVGSILHINYDHTAHQFQCQVDSTNVGSPIAVGAGAYKPVVWGFNVGDSARDIYVCVGS